MNEGFTNKVIYTLTSNDMYLYAGLATGGILTYDLIKLSVDEQDTETGKMLVCYPNPSTGNTMKIDRSGLSIHNTLPVHYSIVAPTGNTVMEFDQSEPQFTISTSGIASGAYYVVARQGVTQSAVRITVVR